MIEAVLGAALGAAAVLVVVAARSRRFSAVPVSEADSAPGADDAAQDLLASLPWADALGRVRVGVVLSGPDGAVLWENDAAGAAAGSRHGRVLVDAACESLRALAVRGDAAHEALDFAGPPPRSLEIAAVALTDEIVACFIEDVTERRRLEQVRADLVANISHELKTPVGAISVLAETLADEAATDVVGRLAGRMVAESQRMARTIEDLIELSRVEMGAGMLSGPVDMGAVANEATDRVRALADKDGIAVSVAAEADCTVTGDAHQLRSAVRNLVDNAVSYSNPGGQVQVRVRRRDDTVSVEVEDHGVGIPATSLDRIFERFYRVDRARSRVTGGSGIGLSIVRHVAGNHGAQIQVRSVEGEGSLFTMTFPASAVGTNGASEVAG